MFVRTLLVMFAIVLSISLAHAQETSSLEWLQSLPEETVETVAVRLEYLGPQDKSLPALVATVAGHDVNWNAFRSAPGMQIDDNEAQERQGKSDFTVAAQDMRNFLRSLVSLGKEPAGQDAIPWLALTVVAGTDGRYRSFHRVFSRREAGDLFVYLRNAFRADPKDISIVNGGINAGAMSHLQAFGCATGLISDLMPADDVTKRVSVARGGLRFNPAEGRFESAVTLKNTSPLAIRGPVSLVVDLSSGNIELVNAHGHTCITKPMGRAFMTLPMPQETFTPGQALETTLWFTGGAGEEIDFTTKVLASPGER